VTYKDFIEALLDDTAPLESYYEGTCEGKFQVCALDCDAYDELMCEAAVQSPVLQPARAPRRTIGRHFVFRR
jgi:hypothetical protein